jgi:hypothetical protein
MSQTHQRRIDEMLDAEYLDGLSDLSTEELRSRREACGEVETELSYVRRLAQGRLDILEAEVERRARGGSVSDLLAMLPGILADDAPRPSAADSRLPQQLAPPATITWRRGLEYLIADSTLLNLPTVDDDELRATLDQLHQLESEVSDRRRRLHVVIDHLEMDLAARLKADPG